MATRKRPPQRTTMDVKPKSRTVQEVRARLTGAKPKPSAGTPPRGGKTTGTPRTPKRTTMDVKRANPPRGGKTTGTPKSKRPLPDVIGKPSGAVERPKPTPSSPPKKLTATTRRKRPLRNSRSPFVFEYK